MWKPGQIVTVCGKVCRVKKVGESYSCAIRVCHFCAFRYVDAFKYPCIKCCFEQKICKLPQECYLEAIK